MNKVFKKILPVIKNKYLLTGLLFLLWMLFFDQNNFIDRFKAILKIKQLEADKEYFNQKIVSDKQKLEELRTDRENLEKFAREQYYMKKDGEDIFIVEDE
jgi:cell division protein DivIC